MKNVMKPVPVITTGMKLLAMMILIATTAISVAMTNTCCMSLPVFQNMNSGIDQARSVQ